MLQLTRWPYSNETNREFLERFLRDASNGIGDVVKTTEAISRTIRALLFGVGR